MRVHGVPTASTDDAPEPRAGGTSAAGQYLMTTRPSILPCFISSRTALISWSSPGGHLGVDLAASVEVHGFDHVLAGADDGAADREPLEDDLEDRCGEVPRGQAVEDDGAAAPCHVDRLAECRGVHG